MERIGGTNSSEMPWGGIRARLRGRVDPGPPQGSPARAGRARGADLDAVGARVPPEREHRALCRLDLPTPSRDARWRKNLAACEQWL